jgi:hypothetical protein
MGKAKLFDKITVLTSSKIVKLGLVAIGNIMKTKYLKKTLSKHSNVTCSRI